MNSITVRSVLKSSVGEHSGSDNGAVILIQHTKNKA